MILQNISKAIREQNYYAVMLEFVIVIAGVAIGFQIQAWNEARAERAQGAANLALIVEEIQQHRAHAEQVFDASLSILDDIRTVERGMNDPPYARENPGVFLRAVFRSRYGSYRAFDRTIYEGMESSGGIALIEDVAVLRRIREHYYLLELNDSIFDGVGWNPRENYDRAMAGYLGLNALVGTWDQDEQDLAVELYNAQPVAPAPELAEDIARRLAVDPAVRKWLPDWAIYHSGVRETVYFIQQRIDELLLELDAPPGDRE